MQPLSRREFLKTSLGVTLGMTALGAGGLAYARTVEPGWIDITQLRLRLPRLSPAFHGYRLVQISDIHMDYWMTRERLAGVVRLVNDQRPDLVAITGDFVTHGYRRRAENLEGPLRSLRARDGAVAVLGNHDHWSSPAFVRSVISNSGIVNVSNRIRTVQRGRDVLHVAGVDDHWEGQDRLDLVLDHLPPEGAAILLAHEPDFADISAAARRFDLQISGHSHGGQVRLPLLGAPILPPYGRKYPLGLYRVTGMLLYTNRGVGMLRPHIRLNCRPEITVYTFEAA